MVEERKTLKDCILKDGLRDREFIYGGLFEAWNNKRYKVVGF